MSTTAFSPRNGRFRNAPYKFLFHDREIALYARDGAYSTIPEADHNFTRMPSTVDVYDDKKVFNYESIAKNILRSFLKTKFTDFAIKCGQLIIHYSKFDLVKKSVVFGRLVTNTNMIEICNDESHIPKWSNAHILIMFAILEGCKIKYLTFADAIAIYRLARSLKFQSVLDYLVDSDHLIKGYQACDDIPGLLDQLIRKHPRILFAGDLWRIGRCWYSETLRTIKDSKIIPDDMFAQVKKYTDEQCKNKFNI